MSAGLDRDEQQARDRLKRLRLEEKMRKADRIMAVLESNGHTREAAVWRNACRHLFENNDPIYFAGLEQMIRLPVTIEEFVDSKEFVADFVELWPQVMCSRT